MAEAEHRNWPKLWIRFPPDLKSWIEQEADRNFGSQNSEIVRAVRERMERMTPATGEKFGDRTPAAGPNETALAGGPITHR